MRVITLSDLHSISLYGSIYELPVSRYLEMQVYLVQASGIGSTTHDISRRFERTGQLLAAGRTVDAGNELANLHYAFQFALERFSPEHLAFGCLVAEVDGQLVTDYSEEALKTLLNRLSGYGLTAGLVADELESVKKKIEAELSNLYPEKFGHQGEETAVTTQQRRHFLAYCDYLLTEDSHHLDTIRQVEEWLLELSLPDVFDDGDPRNVLVQLRRTFADNCAVLADNGTPQADLLTVFQFQARTTYLEKKLKASLPGSQ